MYNQMWSNINRHILIVWQSLGTLTGAIIILVSVKKEYIPIDYSVTIIICISTFAIVHVYDASVWYFRNLVIITNIERIFLGKEDLCGVCFLFGERRDPSKMLHYLKLQIRFCYLIAFVSVCWHFYVRIYSIILNNAVYPCSSLLPYICILASLIMCYRSKERMLRKNKKIDEKSPGVLML